MSKVSGPLLDRIDIHVEVGAVKYRELSSERTGEPSTSVRERVVEARNIQEQRFTEDLEVFKNADMGSREIRKHCRLDSAGQELLKNAMGRLGLSARAYDKILKVARTVADLGGKALVGPEHLSEAIQYRSLDRQFWNV